MTFRRIMHEFGNIVQQRLITHGDAMYIPGLCAELYSTLDLTADKLSGKFPSITVSIEGAADVSDLSCGLHVCLTESPRADVDLNAELREIPFPSLGALDFEQRHGVRCREPENPFELFKALPVDSIIQALERLLLRQSVIVVGNEEPTSYTQLFNAMETFRALLYPFSFRPLDDYEPLLPRDLARLCNPFIPYFFGVLKSNLILKLYHC